MKSKKKYIKGFLEDIVLKMIVEHEEMYGYELTREVSIITNGSLKITEGALYPVLHRLENNGLLTSSIREYEGRHRKYYKVTEKGGLEVSETLKGLEEFIGGLQSIFKLTPERL